MLSVVFVLNHPALSRAEGEKAVISSLQGTAVILRQNQVIPAGVGMACQKNDLLKTSPDCTLDLSINDKAGCRVLAGSDCEITETKESAMKVTIRNGNAIMNLEKLPAQSSFQVDTPTAIASVRGTQFWGRVDLQQANNPVTTFAVRQGEVEILVKAAQKTFTLKPGQALDIPKDSPAPPFIRPALDAELKAMEQASQIKTSA